MTSFIQDALIHLRDKQVDFSQLTFILPSKRAGTFLKKELSSICQTPILSPKIISIESFVEELSQLHLLPNNELLFELYETYLKMGNLEEKDTFDTFLKWGQTLLQDFNEIDRFLVDPSHIFDYLSAIKDIEHWSVTEDPSDLVKNYLSFWKHLKSLYLEFSSHLLENGQGYQGLLYREAVENLETYIQNNSEEHHVFLGFNALNKAEEHIIQELLQTGLAEIYWDIDSTFIDVNHHDAGHFLRSHKKHWTYFQNNSFSFIHDHYQQRKTITTSGIAKNIGQAKYVGEIIQEYLKNGDSLDRTAIVLGDENLLIPVLNALPTDIKGINVTMGLPLRSTPLASLFNFLFTVHKSGGNTFYFKDIENLLSHPFIIPLFESNSSLKGGHSIISKLRDQNHIYISYDKLLSLGNENLEIIKLLFSPWQQQPEIALKCCLDLIYLSKSKLDTQLYSGLISKEYLFRFFEIFTSLENLNNRYKHITSVNILYEIYKELISTETLDFQGEPLQGLQIMGMLETRVLDFERVILVSVNEGILPAGKLANSFIPYDVKKENELPTYKEKDAVYTYHFYHLLQRASDVHIIYNSEPDAMNTGEKSRFIRQMEIEGIHELNHQVVSPKLPRIQSLPFSVPKNNEIIKKLQGLSEKGFSPSSLLTYIRDPLQFYIEKVLGIKEYDEVEETVAANTLGTIIHESLKKLYDPLVGKHVTIPHLKTMLGQLDQEVEYQFSKFFQKSQIRKGKNLIIFEVSKRYISNFLKSEINHLDEGHSIKIIAIEEDISTKIKIPELPFEITIKGQIDRIDEVNGKTRIVDYKTGLVKSADLELVNWEELTTDYDKYSKSFQVLMYAHILNCAGKISLPVEAGVISFKNMNEGFIKFTKKDRQGRGAIKNTIISEDTLINFSNEMNSLILELFNPSIEFKESIKT